ncbi:MAG: NADAR family protein [Endozoicomonas sp.]
MTRQWLEFYRSGQTVIPGQQYTFNQIMNFSDDDLEKKHDFIQQLFPNRTDTRNNSKAPKMTDLMASEIKKSDSIQSNIDRALGTVLKFWGLDWDKGQNVTVNPKQRQAFDTRPKTSDCALDKWCHDVNTIQESPRSLQGKLGLLKHNQLRVTRLLHFLIDIGRPELARNIQITMNDFREGNGAQRQKFWINAFNNIPGKKAQPAQASASPAVKPKVPPKPTAQQWPSAQPAKNYQAKGDNTANLYRNRKPFPQSVTLARWQTSGGAGTAAWQIHQDPSFDPQHHKVGVVVAGNSGLPIGGLANSDGLKETVTPKKLRLKTQEETVVANCLLTTCGEDPSEQKKWVADNVCGKWGLKEKVYESKDTMTLQKIDYTKSKDPEDYADAWVVRDASLSAVAGRQLVPETRVKADLVFCAGPNANPSIGTPTGSMQRTLNQKSVKDFKHFKECVKCTVRAALDGAANAQNTHVLLAPICCGVYAGSHQDKMTDEAFDTIVNEVLDEPVGHQGEQRRSYFVKVIVSDITSSKSEHPIPSSQDNMQVGYMNFKGKDSSTHVGFYDRNKPYYEFTNFWAPTKPLKIDGHTWRTSEHYFQACKFKRGSEEWNNICNNKTVSLSGKTYDLTHPSNVFSYIRAIIKVKRKALQYTPDQWENIKEQVMLNALRAKAEQSPKFRELLVKTGKLPLFETSDKDEYWGTGKDHNGQNRLGVLLMKVRDELNAGLLPEIK